MSEPKFWSTDDNVETLIFEDIQECIMDWAENQGNEDLTGDIDIYGYAHMEPNVKNISERILISLLEDHLDDTYGNPDEYTTPTSGMIEASRVFVESVLKEYKIWGCEMVCKKTVNIADALKGKVEP